MNEQEWMSCSDPVELLRGVMPLTTERKFRLYLCGGCRTLAHLFFDSSSLTSIETAERFADGSADIDELHIAHYHAELPTFGYDFDEGWGLQNWSPATQRALIRYDPEEDWGQVEYPWRTERMKALVKLGALPISVLRGGEWRVNEVVRTRLLAAASLAEACSFYSDLPPAGQPWFERHFREGRPWFARYFDEVDWPGRWLAGCVFGNPFHPVAFESEWITSDTVAMARLLCESRDFDGMRILADALEEVGCTTPAILEHCRSGGPHVRGCWVLDLVLGKQ